MRQILASVLMSVAVALLAASVFGSAAQATEIESSSHAPYNWTGFYLGINGGDGWETLNSSVSFASSTILIPSSAASANQSLSGFVGGGQVGFNWQIRSIVLGMEGDFQGSTLRNSVIVGSGQVTENLNEFGTFRGRLGFAVDRWMPYVTAGWGYGLLRSELNAGSLGAFSSSSSRSFFTAGAGLEAVVWRHVSFKLEYLYLPIGSFTNTYAATFGVAPVGTLTAASSVWANIFRAGLNYHF